MSDVPICAWISQWSIVSRFDPDDRRLGPLSRDVIAVLIEATTADAGISREAAIDVIKQANAEQPDRLWAAGDPDRLDVEIEDVLDSLEQHGFLYSVEGRLFVTDRELAE